MALRPKDIDSTSSIDGRIGKSLFTNKDDNENDDDVDVDDVDDDDCEVDDIGVDIDVVVEEDDDSDNIVCEDDENDTNLFRNVQLLLRGNNINNNDIFQYFNIDKNENDKL